MDYEQKYKKALEMAREAYYSSETPHIAKAWLLTMFPEITESEDEKIRKEFCKDIWTFIPNEKANKYIAWLEKQGEQKPYGQRKECEDCQFNYAGECKGFCQMKKDEQKPADKVEPKFHPGDWVILNGTVAQILDKQKYGFVGLDIDGKDFFCNYGHTDSMRFWSINDAKDGDVLVASDGSIFIFVGVDDCACKYYAALTTDNYLKINKEAKGGYWETSRAVYPATKEQRDTLFAKMKEAGYEWDAGRKELKKTYKTT